MKQESVTSPGTHYKIAVWEVLNEIDFEHNWTPEAYAQFYDAVVSAMRAGEPKSSFMGLALASEDNPRMFEYFLDQAHHQPGTPLDYISYHFYATPREGEDMHTWQYTFWDQAGTFLRTVRYVDAIRKRLSPATRPSTMRCRRSRCFRLRTRPSVSGGEHNVFPWWRAHSPAVRVPAVSARPPSWCCGRSR
jgi:hypothetical protein